MSAKPQQVFIDLSDLRMFIQYSIGMARIQLQGHLFRRGLPPDLKDLDVLDILSALAEETIHGEVEGSDAFTLLRQHRLSTKYAASVKYHAMLILKQHLRYLLPHLIFGIKDRDCVYVGFDLLSADELVVSWTAW